MKTDITSSRQEYSLASLDENDVKRNPFDQFKKWFEETLRSEIPEPNAMVLGTSDQERRPFQRTVLLKGFGYDGFVFYSNYTGTKGRQIRDNPEVSLLFPWLALQRQVIVRGTAAKVSREGSLIYFRSRPKNNQLSAYISNQSETIPSRKFLEDQLAGARKAFENKEVPLPDDWGGYLVKPYFFEFWQGRENRLHDRICFDLAADDWKLSRLSP